MNLEMVASVGLDQITYLIFASAATFAITFLWWAIEIVSKIYLFQKAGCPEWAAVTPVCRDYFFYKMTWNNGWFFLAKYLPLVGLVLSLFASYQFMQAGDNQAAMFAGVGSGLSILFLVIFFVAFFVMSNVRLSIAFGHSNWFALGLIFLYPIFICILAFGDSPYCGIVERNKVRTTVEVWV